MNRKNKMNNRKLVRSTDKRILGGICGGIADYLEIDPTIVRVVAVLLAAFSLGTVVAAYALIWLIMPSQATGMTGLDQVFGQRTEYRSDSRAAQNPGRRRRYCTGPTDTHRAD